MENIDTQSDFSQVVDKLREQNPTREESTKFTYYDSRGSEIYNLLSDINMQIVQLHDDVLHRY